MGKAWCAVIAADDDHRVVEFTDLFESLEMKSERGVESGDLSEVVSEIFANFGDVGEKRRHLTFQCFRVDVPECFAGTFNPLAMNVRRAEPITKRCIGVSSSEEVVEVRDYFVVQFLLGLFEPLCLARPSW